MKADEFKTWLQARRWRGQPLTAKAIQHRRGRLKRVERSLAAMGFPDADVDELIARGELPALLAKLSSYIGSREGAPPVSLVPQAENPDGQLRNLVAVTRLYGRFANGEDPMPTMPRQMTSKTIRPKSAATLTTSALRRSSSISIRPA